MKFTVNKKSFVTALEQFMTKGYLTVKGTNKYNITMAVISCKIGNISFSGRTQCGSIFSRFTLPCTVEQEGTDVIGKLEIMLAICKKAKGEDITIKIDDTTMSFSSGTSRTKYGLSENRVMQDDLKALIDDYVIDDTGVHYLSSNGDERTFLPWFSINNTGEFSTFQDHAISRVKNDVYHVKNDEGNISISVENQARKRDHVVNVDGEYYDNEHNDFSVNFFPAIMNNLNGSVILYHMLGLPDESKRFFIHNGVVDWLVINA